MKKNIIVFIVLSLSFILADGQKIGYKQHGCFNCSRSNLYLMDLDGSNKTNLTNINSVFGLSPNVDWKKEWDESE